MEQRVFSHVERDMKSAKGGNEMHATVCMQVGIPKGNEFVLTFDRFWHDFE